jgi:hypothetical protein
MVKGVKAGRRVLCVEHDRAYRREWQGRNKDKVADYRQRAAEKLKAEVLGHYAEGGKVECVCCGENILLLLTLDHIEEDGAEHRLEMPCRGRHMYRWLQKEGYPPGLQIMCFNCNQGKFRRGVCPHQTV